MSSSFSHDARSRSSAASCLDRLGRGPRLGVRRLDEQSSSLPIGLQVHTTDDRVPEQERQHVVAELPLRLGHVDLDAVVEVEEALGALALPHHRVERAEQCPGVDLARQRGIAVQERRTLPPLDRDRQQLAVLDELVDRDLRDVGAFATLQLEPVVVDEAADRCDPVAAGGTPDQLLGRLGLRRHRGGQYCWGQHPLGHVVDGLELRVAPGNRQVAGEEQVVETLARLGPVPAPVDLLARRAVVEVPSRRRTTVAHLAHAPSRPAPGWSAATHPTAGSRGTTPSGAA